MSARSAKYISVCLAPVLFFLLYFFANRHHFVAPCDPHGDYALISLETEKAKSFEAWSGPYSRFGFRHPLPTYFYYYAAVEPLVWFAETPEAAYNFAQLILNLFFILSAVLIIARLSPWNSDPYLFFSLLIFTLYSARTGILSDLWGPCTVVVPLIAFMVINTGVCCGRLALLPVLALSALFASANHINGAVITVALILFGAVSSMLSLKKVNWDRPSVANTISTLLIILLGLFPVIYELAVAGRESAAIKLLNFILKRSGVNHPTLIDSIKFIATLIVGPLKLVGGGNLLWSIPVILLPWSARFSGDLFTRQLRLITYGALLLSIILVTRIQGELLRYLGMYIFAPITLIYFLGIKAILEGITRITKRALLTDSRYSSLIFAAVALSGIVNYSVRERRCLASFESMTQVIIPQLQKNTSRLVIHDLGLWGAVAGINLKLYRAGFRNCVSKDWGFMYGWSSVCRQPASGTEPLTAIHFYNKNQLRNVPPNAAIGERTIAVVEPTPPFF